MIVFEPDPGVYDRLLGNLSSFKNVTCFNLAPRSFNGQFERVDFIHVEADGMELQILNGFPSILKTAVAIWTKTHFAPSRAEAARYAELRTFLENQGFSLLSHVYVEGADGDALFIKSYIYDALFR